MVYHRKSYCVKFVVPIKFLLSRKSTSVKVEATYIVRG